MADPAPTTVGRPGQLEKGLYPLSSFWTRFIPPALLGLAWWLSDIELVEVCDKAKDWKILAIALPVFWLAASGSTLVSLRPKVAPWVAAGLALLGLVCGGFVSVVQAKLDQDYLGHVLYSATHACLIVAFGLLVFLAMTRANEPPNPQG
jgi:hypothetical protein